MSNLASLKFAKGRAHGMHKAAERLDNWLSANQGLYHSHRAEFQSLRRLAGELRTDANDILWSAIEAVIDNNSAKV